MICKYCGQFIEDDKRFCTNCGAPAAAPASAPVQPQQPAPFPQQPVFRPYPQPMPVKKKGVSKTKTVFFWASKFTVILAIMMFMLPFIKFSLNSGGIIADLSKPLEMTGRELVFGLDDTDDNAGNDLNSPLILISAVAAVVALVLPRGGEWLSGISAAMMYLFYKSADESYTFNGKKISEYNGAIKISFEPAFYACIGVLLLATVLAAVDHYKRKQMFISEQTYGY